VVESLKRGIGLRTDRRRGEIGPGFYSGNDITLFKEFYPTKGDFITAVTEGVSFYLLLK
jgi:hypothetical protein